MALLLILALLFGLLFAGFGGGSSSVGDIAPTKQHARAIKCQARMSAGEGRRNCGGPPANP
jgi:hypothetical protein